MLGLLETMLQIGKVMKRLIFLFFITSIILSCTTEPKESEFSLFIKNNSEQSINVKSYLNGTFISESDLFSGNRSFNCIYNSEFFLGYKLTSCSIDSLVLKFSNNKGYISSINYISTYDFPDDMSPFGASSKFIDLGNNVYEFEITQEDYENSFELPD
jgi:hypothetical protein